MTQKRYGEELTDIFEKKFDLKFKIPIVFIDSHYNKSVPEEYNAFMVSWIDLQREKLIW